MDEIEQKAKKYFTEFHNIQSAMFFNKLHDQNHGIVVILRLLFHSENEIIAKDISERLNISTPRVAAALKTLENKGYVQRTQNEADARKTVVTITKQGEEMLKKQEDELIEMFAYLISTVGEKDLDEFLRIANSIQSALSEKTVQISQKND
jgi:DNA-binding MarR family transcriptional regulator